MSSKKYIQSIPYFGSKRRSLNTILPLLDGRNVVEPFGGSLCVSVNSGGPFVACETHPVTYSILDWLQRARTNDVENVIKYAENRLTTEGSFDGRDAPFEQGAQNFLCVAGNSVRGCLAGYRVTGAPSKRILPFVTEIKRGIILNISCFDVDWSIVPNPVFFIDPPYIKSAANYDATDLTVTDIVRFVRLCSAYGPVVFTFGEQLPGFEWVPLITKNVSKLRADKLGGEGREKGHSKERTEFITWIP